MGLSSGCFGLSLEKHSHWRARFWVLIFVLRDEGCSFIGLQFCEGSVNRQGS